MGDSAKKARRSPEKAKEGSGPWIVVVMLEQVEWQCALEAFAVRTQVHVQTRV